MAQAKTFIMKADGATPAQLGAGVFGVNVVDTATGDSDKTITVDEDYPWQILSVEAAVTTSVVVGNRQIEISVADASGNVLGLFAAGATQAASLTEEYHFGVSGDSLETVAGTHYLPLAPVIWFPNWSAHIWDSAAIDAAPVAAQGTLTIAEPVTDGDTYTIDAKTYTLQTSLTDVDGNVAIGGSEAQTKLNIVAAMDLSGVAGTDYATSMTAHPTVDMAAFSGDDAVLTAKTAGVAGNSIVTTETFTHASNIFDAATLGTTTAGTAGDNVIIRITALEYRNP
jgi:hypothetical protein